MVEPRIAVVIPAYCEEATIGDVVSTARLYCDVIVVNDNSRDATLARAVDAGALVVTNEINLGYDGSLERGLREAQARGYTHAITMDADGEHDPNAVSAFRDLFVAGNSLVIGCRPRKQRWAESVMGGYIYLRHGIHDILCGMKGYSIELLSENGGFDHTNLIGTELAINSIRRGHRFAQVAVGGVPRADAPRFGSLIRANLRILGALLRIIASDFKSAPRASI